MYKINISRGLLWSNNVSNYFKFNFLELENFIHKNLDIILLLFIQDSELKHSDL
jgi:hypothetical protein